MLNLADLLMLSAFAGVVGLRLYFGVIANREIEALPSALKARVLGSRAI